MMMHYNYGYFFLIIYTVTLIRKMCFREISALDYTRIYDLLKGTCIICTEPWAHFVAS